ncbi:MAG TPA: Na+/H+ antiporter [Streptosporangiaceae bacterium]|nr:Na+/H+ antiporter [Streptosporangiaceae bacterium]
MRSVETILVLVVLGTVVAAFAGRLRIPAPSLLVIAGLVIGLLPGVPAVRVSPDAVSLVVLPPLLYAASEELPWRELRAVWRPVIILAVGLVLASAAAVAAVAGAVAGIPASLAFVLGAVLASTDPVAVSALGRRLSLPPRVQALVQAESLFNDGTSLVLFQIAVSFAVAGTAGQAVGGVVLNGAVRFMVLTLGGAAAGSVLAAGAVLLRRRVTDPVLETVIALVTPYAAYVLGTALHVSPVLAVIVAGLVTGGRRDRITSARSRLQLHSVYQTVIFLLESVVFSLIGLQLPTLIRALSGSEAWLTDALAVTGTLIIARMLWVFPLSAVSQRRGGARPSWPVPAVVSWAGTRGVVPLAAALSIPLTTAGGAPLAHRDLILVIAIAAIVISLIVQGLTLGPLVRVAGIAQPGDADEEDAAARLRLAEAALARLEELADEERADDDAIGRTRASLRARVVRARAHAEGSGTTEPGELTDRELRRALNAAEHAELARLYNDGTITSATRQRLQRSLDLEATRLGDNHH